MTEIDEEILRDELKTKRNSLQKEFRMNPSKTRLALEIRLIDNLIASLQLRERNRFEIHEDSGSGSRARGRSN